MERGKRLLPYAGPLLAFLLLTFFEQDSLWTAQEQNLFLHSPLFFEQQMVKAGGLLTWAGAYLTQFFYYPALGAGLLCLLWVLFMWILKRAFRLSSLWMALIPVACMLLTVVNMGYWVYYLKLPGHLFCATLGSMLAVLTAWGYRLTPRKKGLSTIYVLLAACAGYPLFGFYGLWGTALTGVLAWQAEKRRVADMATAAAAVIAVPLVCYHTLFHQTNIVNIYWAALPVYAHAGERLLTYNLPYIVLVVSTFCLALRPRWQVRSAVTRWLRPAALLLAAACVGFFWEKDDNLRRELSMSRSMEQQDWTQMLRTAKGTKGEPTRAICMMKNLALFRLGLPAKEMLYYPEGAKRPSAPFSIRTVHTVGKMLYLQYGLPNYCYRWCMEDGVEYGWTANELKLMALCSLLSGEHVAAQRYLNMLKKTTFFRSWAKEREQYIHHPQLMTEDATLKPILPLLRRDNFLTADQSQLEHFLVEHLLSTPGDTREQQELAQRTMFYYRNNRKTITEQ